MISLSPTYAKFKRISSKQGLYFTLLLLVGLILSQSCKDNSPYDRLVEKYLVPYSASADVEVNGVPNPSWLLGVSKYEEGNYDEMVKAFMKLRPGNPFYYKAHYIMAIVNLQHHKPWKALDNLKATRMNAKGKYFKDAQWLQALAYLQANIPGRTKDILNRILREEEPHPYRNQAKELLEQLP